MLHCGMEASNSRTRWTRLMSFSAEAKGKLAEDVRGVDAFRYDDDALYSKLQSRCDCQPILTPAHPLPKAASPRYILRAALCPLSFPSDRY